MKYRKIIYLLVFLFSRTENRAVAQSSRDSLTQSVQQLQSLTGDAYYTLLEKIIDISTRVKPLPAIPETANEKYVTALALREDASSKDDFESPISLLKEARTLAPWWPDVYKELGATFEQAAFYDTAYYESAIANFQRFLRTQPIQEEARKIQNEIFIANAKREKAIQKQKEEKVNAESDKLKSLIGEWKETGKFGETHRISIDTLPNGFFKMIHFVSGTSYKDTFIAAGKDNLVEYTKKWESGTMDYYILELSKDGKRLFCHVTREGNTDTYEYTRL